MSQLAKNIFTPTIDNVSNEIAQSQPVKIDLSKCRRLIDGKPKAIILPIEDLWFDSRTGKMYTNMNATEHCVSLRDSVISASNIHTEIKIEQEK